MQPVGDVILERGPSPTGLPAIAHDSIGEEFCLDEGRALIDVFGREPAFASRRLFGRNSSFVMVTTLNSILFPILPFMPSDRPLALEGNLDAHGAKKYCSVRQFGTNKPVKAGFWPWFEPFVLHQGPESSVLRDVTGPSRCVVTFGANQIGDPRKRIFCRKYVKITSRPFSRPYELVWADEISATRRRWDGAERMGLG